jgi:hypothetical protein
MTPRFARWWVAVLATGVVAWLALAWLLVALARSLGLRA